jgi:hypothetical protein
MAEQRWSFEGTDEVLREGRRGGTATRSRTTVRPTFDTALLDPREVRQPEARQAPRRFVPYVTESDRDALAATALAAYQAVAQAPSVLDVDASSLRLVRSRMRRQEAEPEVWTPPALPVDEPIAALGSGLGETDAPRRPRSNTLRNWSIGIVTVGLVALLGGGLAIMTAERDEAAVGASEGEVAPADVPDPALQPEAGVAVADAGALTAMAPMASIEGRLTLSAAALYDGAAPDAPVATSFLTGAPVVLRLAYAYGEAEPGDALRVVWYRDNTEFARNDLPLTPDGEEHPELPAPVLDQPGPHRADVTLNDEVVHSIRFDVTAP